jgi:uncharacterized protein involved in exopolysaccharide biosynthesis
MSDSRNSIQQSYIDDEIDLLPYIRHVVSHWRWFVVSAIMGLVVAVVLSLVLPKQYQASTTFFVPESSTSMVSGGLMAQFGFLSSIDGGTSGQYSGYMTPIFNSRRIKHYVAQQLLDDDRFDNAELRRLPEDKRLDHMVGKLEFSKNVTLTVKEGVHVITYRHTNPSVLLPVLDAYLNALINLNDELNIDSDKLQIVPLDEAVEPLGAVFPRRNTFALIGVLGAVVLTCIGLVGSKVVEDLRDR